MVAPGVYIKEDASLSLSVQSGATAVPVFVGNFKKKAGLSAAAELTTGDACVAIASWLEFVAQFEGPVTAKVVVKQQSGGTDRWKAEQTQAWAEQLASAATETVSGDAGTFKEIVEEVLQAQKQGKKEWKWALKTTVELNGFIEKAKVAGKSSPNLRTSWEQAIQTSLIQADNKFVQKNIEAWVTKWVDKTLQQAWQKFNDAQVVNEPLDEAARALTNQQVASDGAIPKTVTERLSADGVTTVNQQSAFILNKQIYSLPQHLDSSEIVPNYGAFALQHYFSNGGANCYVLPLSEDGNLAALPQEIQKHPDISLLICAEPANDLKQKLNVKKADVYQALDNLLDKKLGYFLLADSEDGENNLSTTKSQTAVYSPNLITTLIPSMPAADDIHIVFTDTGEKSTNITLSQMMNKDQSKTLDTFHQAVTSEIAKGLKEYRESHPITLPPSAAVAGAYARTDRERGVWKAPANVSLNAIKRVEKVFTDTKQGQMNDKGINVIRTFTGQGTMVWGARTLDVKSDDWKYIPVRRLFNAAERDIKQAMQFAVFETNSSPTWGKVKSAVESYLYSLWRQGALMGNSEKEAYFVQIGKDITMSKEDIDNGRMIVKVGMAAVRPAEFIILQFTQNVAQ